MARGISSRKLNDVIKAATGQGIRRQVLLDFMRAVRGTKQKSTFLKFLKDNALPNINRLPAALTKIQRRLSFLVEVRGILVESGETIIQHVTLAMDNPLSKARMQQMAVQIVEDQQERYGIEVDRGLLISGVRAELAGSI